jgi:hypothetical protein
VVRSGKIKDSGGGVDQGEVIWGTSAGEVIEVICLPEGNSSAVGVGEAIETRG